VHIASGFIAELAGAFIWTPMDVVKQRMMVSRESVATAPSGVAVVRSLLEAHGPRGLFRGYGLGVAVYGPFAAVYFATYERGKVVLGDAWRGGAAPPGQKGDDVPLPLVVTAGFVAGATAATVTCPLDVVKTRFQVSEGASRYTSARRVLADIFAHESPRVLVNGLAARVLWIAPATAITISSYEFFKRFAPSL
jgi:hypothetical protein